MDGSDAQYKAVTASHSVGKQSLGGTTTARTRGGLHIGARFLGVLVPRKSVLVRFLEKIS
jgi:hypothetical protein